MGHVYMCMMNPGLALREGYERAISLNPESPEALSGAMAAAMLMEGPNITEADLDPDTGPVGALGSALRRLLPVEPPLGLDGKLKRLG